MRQGNKENEYRECMNSIAGIMSILQKSKQSRSQKVKMDFSGKSPINIRKPMEVVQRMEIDNLRRVKLKEQQERIREEKKQQESREVERYQKSRKVMSEKEKQLLTDKLMQDAYRRQKQKERSTVMNSSNFLFATNPSQSHGLNKSVSPFRSKANDRSVLEEFLNQSIIQGPSRKRQIGYSYFEERTSPFDLDYQ